MKLKSSSSSFSHSSSKSYRRLPACLAPSAMLLALCCLLSQAHAAGSWLADGQPVDSPEALFTDGSTTMQAPLVFDPCVSSAVSGLFKATVPWDFEYDFFTFNETYETIVLSPSISSLGFEAGNLVLHGGGVITHPGEGTSINFEEHSLNGGWFLPTVENDAYTLMNRTYADTRYLLRTEGITVNHTIQAGDVLQIQDGLITAINPP